MREHLSKGEIRKDALQHTVEAGAEAVASVSTILATAVRDVAQCGRRLRDRGLRDP